MTKEHRTSNTETVYQQTKNTLQYNIWVFVNEESTPWQIWKHNFSNWEAVYQAAEQIHKDLVEVDPYYLAVAILPADMTPFM